MKFIYYLEGTSPRTVTVTFNGARGSYRFIWSAKHRAHIFEGRELDAPEFNKLTNDLFVGNTRETTFTCVPRAVESEDAVNNGVVTELREKVAMLEAENRMLNARPAPFSKAGKK